VYCEADKSAGRNIRVACFSRNMSNRNAGSFTGAYNPGRSPPLCTLCLHSEPKPDVSIELPGEEYFCSTVLYELSKFGRVLSGNERLFVRVEVATILAAYSSSSTSWSSYLHLYFVFRRAHILTGLPLSLLLELEFAYLTLSSWGPSVVF
jgi:hypothetical protein